MVTFISDARWQTGNKHCSGDDYVRGNRINNCHSCYRFDTDRTLSDAVQEDFERKVRQAVFMLLAAIAKEYGAAMAARIVKGLFEKYVSLPDPK